MARPNDEILALWRMPPHEFNEWRRHNDLPQLLAFFKRELPHFEEWQQVHAIFWWMAAVIVAFTTSDYFGVNPTMNGNLAEAFACSVKNFATVDCEHAGALDAAGEAISTSGGRQPRWAPSGSGLFFFNERGERIASWLSSTGTRS
jgi:hypothetical protein